MCHYGLGEYRSRAYAQRAPSIAGAALAGRERNPCRPLGLSTGPIPRAGELGDVVGYCAVGAALVGEPGEVSKGSESDLGSFDISGEEHVPQGIGQPLDESRPRRIVHRKVPSLFALAAGLRRRFSFV